MNARENILFWENLISLVFSCPIFCQINKLSFDQIYCTKWKDINYREKKLLDFTRSRSTCHLFDFGHELLNIHFMIQEYILLLVVRQQITHLPLTKVQNKHRSVEATLSISVVGVVCCHTGREMKMLFWSAGKYLSMWQCDTTVTCDMWRTYDKITSKHQVRQGPRSLLGKQREFHHY